MNSFCDESAPGKHSLEPQDRNEVGSIIFKSNLVSNDTRSFMILTKEPWVQTVG